MEFVVGLEFFLGLSCRGLKIAVHQLSPWKKMSCTSKDPWHQTWPISVVVFVYEIKRYRIITVSMSNNMLYEFSIGVVYSICPISLHFKSLCLLCYYYYSVPSLLKMCVSL